MDKAVKACHDPPAKSGKPAGSTDDDDIDSLRVQLEKSEAHAKKLADRLSEANRKAQGPRDLKDPVCERNLSSPLARRGGVGRHAVHGTEAKTAFIATVKRLVPRSFARFSFTV